ncbi:photosystem II stability/assembly factor-like uncharacterized protein [Paenibacillus phyllosphaerae]|uniref:Photosystem II stability/assembly factor-like uncharacterized protein n=1 Tax=Paenibacillus phyllosphaerae TaxID=274593 RepID=A0A7W5B2F9_9BACL|nr:hypothetical protein [Paenibacillus phyllosphaerae]MBB3113205.1 photosystem II stability/assembly factor-like uncharacterized protein [Paenibacillus phyllosphaerae]
MSTNDASLLSQAKVVFVLFTTRTICKGAAALTLALSLILSGCGKENNSSAQLPTPAAEGGTSNGNTNVAPEDNDATTPNNSSSSGNTSPATNEPAEQSGSAAENPAQRALAISTVTALRLADAKTGWATGDGQIARTDDGGAHWEVQRMGDGPVVQLFALSSSKVWATLGSADGKSAKLIQSTDGGKTWTEAGTVPNQAYLHFTDDRTAFSGNYMTTDGGANWQALNVPDQVAGDVYFHDLNNGWAVQSGKGKYSLMHSADGGKTWKAQLTKTGVEAETLGTVIRSTGKDDAWIEIIGGSGMSQTSYALFHTSDGGKNWLPAIVKHGAGSGPAPGFTMEDDKYPSGTGNGPGALYVVDPKTAFAGGRCSACDKPNSISVTTDGGKTWTASKEEFAGFGTQYIAAADAKHVWLVTTDAEAPSVMYTSADGGKTWSKAFTFDKPKAD